MPERSLAIEATGLSLVTRRGTVYEGIDLAIPRGSLAMLVGPTGSGKTALLLTLAGRMRATGGSLRVMGTDARRRPSAARRMSALGPFGDLNGLADPLTVRHTVAADSALASCHATPDRTASVLGSVGLDRGPDTRVADLSAIERVLLGVALALVGSPEVLVCDDTDHDLTPDEQRRLRETLREVAASGVTVVGACVDPRAAEGADVVVAVPRAIEGGDRS